MTKIIIRNDGDYNRTMKLLNYALEIASDDHLDPLHQLIKIMALEVERYEDTMPEVVEWHKKIESM